jgi:superkiller protein 3
MSEEGERLLLQQLQKEKDEKSRALIYQVLAEFKLQNGETETAIEFWYSALKGLPDDYSIRHDLALVLQNEIRLEEALTQNYEILRIVEERLKKPYNAKVNEHDPITVADMVSAHINIGDMLSFQGKTEEAIAHYSQALQLDPDEASAHTGMGIALAENGQATEAIDHLSTALKITPESAEAHMYLGDIMNRQERLEEAIYHYSEGLKIEPDYAEGHNNLGVVYAKQGNIDKAAESFASAVKIDPGLADAHYNLGRALTTLGNAEEAMFHFNEAQKIQAGL